MYLLIYRWFTSFFFILVLLILNLFFYSFITIALYKFLCYDSSSLVFYTDNVFFKKILNIFYLSDTYYLSYILDTTTYNTVFFSHINTGIFKYVFFYFDNTYLNIPCYCFNNSSIIQTLNYNLVFLNFYIRTSNLNWINSISLQKTIILNVNESGLFFFRIYNPSHLNIKLVTLYMIYPNLLSLYVNKIQCFCFNIIFLYPLELVDLPVLIYITPFFSMISNTFYNNIIIYYIIFLH